MIYAWREGGREEGGREGGMMADLGDKPVDHTTMPQGRTVPS